MKKLKKKPIGPFRLVFLLVFLVNCKNSQPEQEDRGMEKDTSHEMTLAKESFVNCTGARDTVFANGDYLKYISIDKEHYGIEIKIKDVLDTLDFYLDCTTQGGMIPKVLFRSGSGYVGLAQGSSSYRYLTLCSLNREVKKIAISKFETAIDMSSGNDGFLFVKENWLVFYDRNSEKFSCKNLLRDRQNCMAKEFELHKNSAVIVCKEGGSKTYFLNELIVRDSMP